MDRVSAKLEVEDLLGTDILGLLSTAEQERALDATQVDGDWDPWLAAAEIASRIGNRAARGEVREWESDGQRVKRSPSDWYGLADRMRALSPRSGGALPDFAFLIV